VIFTISPEEITIVRIGHRSEIYDPKSTDKWNVPAVHWRAMTRECRQFRIPPCVTCAPMPHPPSARLRNLIGYLP